MSNSDPERQKKTAQMKEGKDRAMRSWDKHSTETQRDEWAEGGTGYILSVFFSNSDPALFSVSYSNQQHHIKNKILLELCYVIVKECYISICIGLVFLS